MKATAATAAAVPMTRRRVNREDGCKGNPPITPRGRLSTGRTGKQACYDQRKSLGPRFPRFFTRRLKRAPGSSAPAFAARLVLRHRRLAHRLQPPPDPLVTVVNVAAERDRPVRIDERRLVEQEHRHWLRQHAVGGAAARDPVVDRLDRLLHYQRSEIARVL